MTIQHQQRQQAERPWATRNPLLSTQRHPTERADQQTWRARYCSASAHGELPETHDRETDGEVEIAISHLNCLLGFEHDGSLVLEQNRNERHLVDLRLLNGLQKLGRLRPGNSERESVREQVF